MEDKETRYKVDGSDLLNNLEPDKGFYFKYRSKDDTSKKYCYEPIKLGLIWVSGGPDKFMIHVKLQRKQLNGVDSSVREFRYEISEEDYKKFQLNKKGKFRLALLTKASDGLIVTRKETATMRIDMRVRPKVYKELAANAEKCKMTVTEYCRTVCENGKVVAAFSDNEIELMTKISQLSSQLSHYSTAMKNGFFRNMSPQERLHFLGTAESLDEYRKEIRQVITYLHKFVKNRNV